MASTEKILELIDKGDCLSILAEDSLQETFNELLKYNFIDIVDDRIVLTPKGEEAKALGVEKVLAQLRGEKEPDEIPEEIPEEKELTNSNLYPVGLRVLIALFLIFLIASPLGCSLIQ